MVKETLIEKRYYELISDDDKFTALVQKDIEIDSLKERVKELEAKVKAHEADASDEKDVCVLDYVSFSEASDCKYRSCNYNGTKRCTAPYCSKYERGEAEVCQHTDTYKKIRFGVELERCKDCDSFWQT